MKNELPNLWHLQIEFELIHANLRGMYGCINQSEVLQRKQLTSSLKPVKYLIFNI
jgi:hypothetical protein